MSGAPSKASLISELTLQIVAQSESKLTVADIDPEAEICDRGYLDSLTYVSFLVFVEDNYGVRILDHELTGNLRSVSAIADHLLREAKG